MKVTWQFQNWIILYTWNMLVISRFQGPYSIIHYWKLSFSRPALTTKFNNGVVVKTRGGILVNNRKGGGFPRPPFSVTVVVESGVLIHDHRYSKCGRESYIIHDHTLWNCGRGLFTTHICICGSWIRYFPRPQSLKCGRGKSGGFIWLSLQT